VSIPPAEIRPVRHASVLLLLTAPTFPAFADEPDRLPPGAIARLGDPKFRAGGAAFALSPDGKIVAVVEGDLTIRLRDVETWAEQRRLEVPPPPPQPDGRKIPEDGRRRIVSRLQFDQAGRRLAAWVTGTYYDYLAVWDPATGQVERTVAHDGGRLDRTAVVSADLSRAARIGPEVRKGAVVAPRAVHLRDIITGESITPLKAGLPNEASGLALSAGGSRIALWGRQDLMPDFPRGPGERPPRPDPLADKHEFPVFDLAAGKEVGRVRTPEPARAVVFSPDGTRVAVQYGYGNVDERVVWDLAARKALCRFVCREVSGPTFFLGNDAIGAVSRGGVFQRRELPVGRLAEFVAGPGGVPDPLTVATAVRPDGSLRFCARDGAGFIVWDLVRGEAKPARTFSGTDGLTRPPVGLAFLPDGKKLRALTEDGVVLTWDVPRRRLVGRLNLAPPQSRFPDSDRFAGWLSPDGRSAFVAAGSGTRIWDVERSLDVGLIPGVRPAESVTADGRVVDGAGDPERAVRALKPAADGTPVQFGVSADGRLGAVIYTRRNARNDEETDLVVFDLPAGKPLNTIRIPRVYDGKLSFSPNGRCIVQTGSHSVSVWAWESGRNLLGAAFGPHAPGFSADGRLVARAIADGYGVSWGLMVSEVVSGGLRFRFPVCGNGTVAFAPDGKTLAAPAPDGTLLLWDLTKPAGSGPPKTWSPAEADAIWTGLADPDAGRGFAHLARLAAFPDEAVALIRERTKPTDDAIEIARLIRRLDDDGLGAREAAGRELAQFGARVEEPARTALAADPSPEARRRLEFLLDDLKTNATFTSVRPTRAVEVLERIGTAAAKTVLEDLAKGEADTVIAREAKAALARLGAGPR
jgi:WD40 repeat protein